VLEQKHTKYDPLIYKLQNNKWKRKKERKEKKIITIMAG
jgi:hypothetical protein